MEKRTGTTIILIRVKDLAQHNSFLLSECKSILPGYQELPLHHHNIIVDPTNKWVNTSFINALTGKYGRLNDVETKSILNKHKEEHNHEQWRKEQSIH
jgi:hypothetical protein